jgi:hypothetical protein
MEEKLKIKHPQNKALVTVRSFFPQVKTVLDANKATVVEVTRADIDKSKIKDHQTCALAVCCHRSFHADGVIIGLTTAYIIKGTTAHRYKLTGTISREITSFDRGAGYDEGEYLLAAPCPGSRLGAPHRGGNRTGTGRKRQFRHYTKNVRVSLRSV